MARIVRKIKEEEIKKHHKKWRKRLLKWLKEEKKMVSKKLDSGGSISLREGKLWGSLYHLGERLRD